MRKRGPYKRKPSPLDGIEHEEVAALHGTAMTVLQQRFAISYLRHHNATRAVRESGSACKAEHASTWGVRLLAVPSVRAFVSERMSIRLERLGVTDRKIEEELARVAFASLADVMVVHEDRSVDLDLSLADADFLAAVQELTTERPAGYGDGSSVKRVKVKLHSKLDALGKLAQIRKMIGAGPTVTLTVDSCEEIRAARRRAGMDEDSGLVA